MDLWTYVSRLSIYLKGNHPEWVLNMELIISHILNAPPHCILFKSSPLNIPVSHPRTRAWVQSLINECMEWVMWWWMNDWCELKHIHISRIWGILVMELHFNHVWIIYIICKSSHTYHCPVTSDWHPVAPSDYYTSTRKSWIPLSRPDCTWSPLRQLGCCSPTHPGSWARHYWSALSPPSWTSSAAECRSLWPN